MLIASSGSGVGRRSVALLPSPVRRQTKPGLASASALTRSSASKNGATRGSPSGATRRPMLTCARCQSGISVELGAPATPDVDDAEQEQPYHVDEVPVPRSRFETEVL